MAQYARPIADISTGSWGATPLYAELSESTPDDGATQIQSANRPSNDTFEVRLSVVTDPLASSGHVVRIRMYGDTSHTWSAYLYQGTTLIKTLVSGAAPPSAYTTFVYALTAAEADSITDYSDLRVRVVADGGAKGREYVTWIEMEVPNVVIARAGSAFVSGGGQLLSSIRKTALVLAALGTLGHVVATGFRGHDAKVSGGWKVPKIVTDDFARANEDPLAAPWASARVLYGGLFDDNVLESNGITNKAIYGRKTVAYHSDNLGADQESSIVAKENSFVGAAVRAGFQQGYAVYAVGEGYPGRERFQVFRFTPGQSGSLIADFYSDVPAWTSPGRKLTLRATGTDLVTLKVFSDDLLIGTVVDSSASRILSGNIGVACLTQYHHVDSVSASEYLVFAFGQKSTGGSASVGGQGNVGVFLQKHVETVASIHGGGNVYVWSQDAYGTVAISAGGSVGVFGSKGHSTLVLSSGGGTVAGAGEKSASSSSVETRGGGVVAFLGRKDVGKDALLVGGGTVFASAREDARYPAVFSGGGEIISAIAKGAKGRSGVSEAATIIFDGTKGAHGQAAVAGGGEVAATGDAVAGTFVWALIRGGGAPSAGGRKEALASSVLSGGGSLNVRSVRSWPLIDLTSPPDTDSTALLVLLDLDWCGRTFGISPCLAAGTPCYNTWRTCRYISAYQNVGRTYRFCSADFPQVFDDARPYVTSVRWMPTEIKTNLTVNARVVVDMADEPDADVGIDPYWDQRVSHPGTFWRKFLARNVNYRGRTLKVYEGRPGAPESTYVLRWIGKLDNITVKGAKVSIESVDLMKDLAKIEVPPKVNAKLAADVAVDYTLGLSLTEDADRFAASGYVRIDDEIIRYETKDDTTKQLSTLSRAQFGTAAAEHKAKTKVQPVRYFEPKSGFDHLLDMLLVDAGIDPVYVDADSFAYYRDWPQADIDFTAVVSEPKKLSDLFFEVVDLLDCKVWVAENLKITIRRNIQNSPGRSYHVLSDEDDIALNSGSVDHNEKSRITRVSVYWDKVVTSKDGESTSYRRLDVAVDPDAEENYDGPIEKTILCRWIDPTCGEESKIARFVRNLSLRRITRQRDAQPLVTVELPPKDREVLTGDYVRLSTDEILGPDGGPITRRVFQVVKRDRRKEMFNLTLLQVAQRRVCIIGPAGLPDYGAASETWREYGYVTGPDGKMSDGSDGYFIW